MQQNLTYYFGLSEINMAAEKRFGIFKGNTELKEPLYLEADCYNKEGNRNKIDFPSICSPKFLLHISENVLIYLRVICSFFPFWISFRKQITMQKFENWWINLKLLNFRFNNFIQISDSTFLLKFETPAIKPSVWI